LFFTDHEWDTIEAATGRIMPSDDGKPGAKEACVTFFIDRYLSGIDYVYASADGKGFLRISGKEADAWRARISDLQTLYREGIVDLDRRGQKRYKKPFVGLDKDAQDVILAELSGGPKPQAITLTDKVVRVAAGAASSDSGASDDHIPFFNVLALHTRQGMYGDPAYGGNRDFVGWRLIGFDGPRTLEDTNNGTFSVEKYMLGDMEWPYRWSSNIKEN
jgi:gluconate 2-dehydrogenase gamma chain